jgi:hypothetical protein
MEHTFVVPVYRAAPNLSGLIASLRSQTGVPSEILLTSSTPSADLVKFAECHALPLHINPRRIDIATDWNFALGAARTSLVTLAHQDDLFAPAYTSRLRDAMQRNPGALMAFCDYSEHTTQGERRTTANLRIKRALRLIAFRTNECISEPRHKKRLLSFGNPICCPSVMFNRRLLEDFRFPSGFQTNLDWMAWLQLARRSGGFVYTRGRLVSKGVHLASETSITIATGARAREDRMLFDTLWPRPVAATLAAVYKLGYNANRI